MKKIIYHKSFLGLPYEEMGYCPPPNRKLPPVPGQHSNYNTIDRIKNGKLVRLD